MISERKTSSDDFVFGRWPVKEALEAGPVSKIFLANGISGGPIQDILALARQKKVPFLWVERRRLDQLAGQNHAHQGVLAYVSPIQYIDMKKALEGALSVVPRGPSLLFLDGVQDPHNLGSLLRTAQFFGVAAVIIPKWRAATVTPSVVRSSAGAARWVPIAQVSNMASAMEEARKKGFWLVGADMSGEDVRTVDVPRPLALVLGAEGEGLHNLVRKKCDVVVAIKKVSASPGIDSLNVGVAGGILIHQLARPV